MGQEVEEDADRALGEGKVVFVVSPIGSKLEPLGSPGRSRYEENLTIWSEVIEPACAQFGLKPVRADKIASPGELPDQIFTYLRDADVVIADLTHGNANVMYELGLRHSRSAITVQIGEYERLPFDVQSIRTQQFIRTEAGLIAARNQLVETLRAALQDGATKLRATEIFQTGSAVPASEVEADAQLSVVDDDDADDDEPGALEMAAEGEAALARIADDLSDATQILQEFGALASDLTGDMTASDAAGKGFAGRLNVTKQHQPALQGSAAEFESKTNEFLSDAGQVDALVRWMLQKFQAEPEAGASSFAESLLGMIDAAETSAVTMVTFKAQAGDLKKVSRTLKGTADAIERGATRMLEGIGIISGWRQDAEAVKALEV